MQYTLFTLLHLALIAAVVCGHVQLAMTGHWNQGFLVLWSYGALLAILIAARCRGLPVARRMLLGVFNLALVTFCAWWCTVILVLRFYDGSTVDDHGVTYFGRLAIAFFMVLIAPLVFLAAQFIWRGWRAVQ